MNEHLKELAKRSGIMFESSKQNRIHSINTDTLEKFAGLVIKECVTIINNRYMGDNNREDMEVRRCVEDLTKHFGVKDE